VLTPRAVVVRPPGAAFRRALSTFGGHADLDARRAGREHARFVREVAAAGVRVVALPRARRLPDATFVSDTMLVLPPAPGRRAGQPLVVVARPGEPSRRPEVASVLGPVLTVLGGAPRVHPIVAPGTLDGGDVITWGDRLAIGVSGRTNLAGARQLAEVAASAGYRPLLCPVRGRLHLASEVSVARDSLIVGTAAGLASLEEGEPGVLAGMEIIRVTDGEAAAANVLPLGGSTIVAGGYPGVAASLRAVGEPVVEVALDEMIRADAGPSCLVVLVP
jgi:dimethylargininase